VVIDQFLQKTPNATLTPIALPGAYLSSRGLQYFPEIDRQDGFFYSLLVKKV
jgi:16S rRNA C967 or C1407 C5-methylase (RsmB/RsmF family)